MKKLPRSSVQYLRPYSCSSKADCTKCPSFGRDCHFPNPYNATKQELESVPYITELWNDDDGKIIGTDEDTAVVVTFGELRKEYDNMNANVENDGYMSREEFDECWPDVYAWLRDCIDNGYHPCSIIG